MHYKGAPIIIGMDTQEKLGPYKVDPTQKTLTTETSGTIPYGGGMPQPAEDCYHIYPRQAVTINA